MALQSTFGSSLRWWRTSRRLSQLSLAMKADVSSRHLSFLEKGRAQPSREMVIHLAEVLDIPLRDRNLLLHSAGFAPQYPHNEFPSEAMTAVRNTLLSILRAYSPNPTLLLDHLGNVLESNAEAARLLSEMVPNDSHSLRPVPNVNRVTLHPSGARNAIVNWGTVAQSVLLRLEREVAFRPSDGSLSNLLIELLNYPGIAELRKAPASPQGAELVVPLKVKLKSGKQLSLLTTIATVGAPYDVTLEEIRIETFFPLDSVSRNELASWGDW